MAIFGKKMSASASRNDTVARAVLVPAVSTMVADGEVSQVELDQLSNVCGFSPIFFKYTQDEMLGMIREIIDEISQSNVPTVVKKATKDLSPPLRETALCFAMRIAVADGRLDENEKSVLAGTASVMGISQEKFGVIFEVVAMMQRPAAA